MTSATLALDVALATLTAAMFAYAGFITYRRVVHSKAAKRALVAFTAWWFGLAAFTLLSVTREVLVLAGNVDITTHSILSDISVGPLVILLWGLVSYLAYIYTGKWSVFPLVTALHVAILAFYLTVEVTLVPTSVTVNDWSVGLEYAGGVPSWQVIGVLLTMLVPSLFAAILYASLFFRTTDPTARYRIGLVSGAFILWFGSAGVAGVTALRTWYYWPISARLIGVIATIIILAAYLPPKIIQSKFGIETTAN